MTDIHAMLAAARALHERGTGDPSICETCAANEDGTPAYWPCPTALALGATGRSEWVTPGTPPTSSPNERCDGYDGDVQCVLTSRHLGRHVNTFGERW